MTEQEPVENDDHTVTWMGHTVAREYLASLRAKGLNPWLTIVSGQPVPLRESHDTAEAAN